MLVYNLYIQMTPYEEDSVSSLEKAKEYESTAMFEGAFSSLEKAKEYVRKYYYFNDMFNVLKEINISEQELDDPFKSYPQWVYVFNQGKIVRAFTGRWVGEFSDLPLEF